MNTKTSSAELPVSEAGGRSVELVKPLIALLQAPPGCRPPEAAIVQVASYRQYVETLARQLDHAVRAALGAVRDEAQLVRMAGELLKIELDRQAFFAPLLAPPPTPVQMDHEWRKLGDELRDGMNTELAALRDGRLRLEFRRAEMLNQQHAATRIRVVLRGGTQIKLYLNRRRPDDTAKG